MQTMTQALLPLLYQRELKCISIIIIFFAESFHFEKLLASWQHQQHHQQADFKKQIHLLKSKNANILTVSLMKLDIFVTADGT